MFGPQHDYKVGDDAWIYLGNHQGVMTKCKVIALLDNLPGWSFRQYVVEIDSHIDPILEIRSSSTMRPVDPRVTEIAQLLNDLIRKVVEEKKVDTIETAFHILETADSTKKH